MSKSKKYTQRGTEKKAEPTKEGVFRDWLQFEKYKHYDPELEGAILGICMLEADGMARIRRLLAADMFYIGFHRSVYRAMVTLYDKGFPIDLLTVVNQLYSEKDECIQNMINLQLSVPHEVTKLTYSVVRGNHLDYWAILVRDQFIQRTLLEITTGGLGEAPAREELQKIQQRIDDLLQFRSGEEDWTHISDLMVKLWQHILEVEGQDIVGLPFGFRYLDQITSGIPPGLYYLAARPSVGKTAFALKMIINQASLENPVGIISLETPGTKLAARVLSMSSEIDFWRIWRSKLGDERRARLYTYTDVVASLPIYVSDEPAVDLNDIRAKTFKLIKLGAKAIYIDYIQLAEMEQKGTREQEVATFSRGLKLLSMQTNIPIIGLAQLSRETEKRNDKTPRLFDLRESGALEQDADGVMMLHRPEKSGIENNEDGSSTKGEASLIISKWRDGQTFTHPMKFNGDRMEFTEDDFAIEEAQGWNGRSGPAAPDFPAAPNVPPPKDFTISKREGKDDDDPF